MKRSVTLLRSAGILSACLERGSRRQEKQSPTIERHEAIEPDHVGRRVPRGLGLRQSSGALGGVIGVLSLWAILVGPSPQAATPSLSLAREGHWLIIQGPKIPSGEIRINYLEAYCRAGSTDAEWGKYTVIGHHNEFLSLSADRTELRMRDTLADGLTVEHIITARADEVEFRLVARNPTARRSEAHWAQPCVRLGAFTGFSNDLGKGDINDYLPKCFVFLEGRLTRMPTPEWAQKARYIPGQVWCPQDVPRTDVNPRPLSRLVTSNGLIGCFSGDEKLIFATAFEPYQELFQGVARCLHSDFRLGGLAAGGTKLIRGKIYIVPNDVPALLKRYAQDFPEHVRGERH